MVRLLLLLSVLRANEFFIPDWVWAISFLLCGFSALVAVANVIDKHT